MYNIGYIMIKISDRFFFLFLISSSVALAANFSLPALPYAYDALIASIDTQVDKTES